MKTNVKKLVSSLIVAAMTFAFVFQGTGMMAKAGSLLPKYSVEAGNYYYIDENFFYSSITKSNATEGDLTKLNAGDTMEIGPALLYNYYSGSANFTCLNNRDADFWIPKNGHWGEGKNVIFTLTSTFGDGFIEVYYEEKAPSEEDEHSTYYTPLVDDIELQFKLAKEADPENTEKKTITYDVGDALPVGVFEALNETDNISLYFEFEYEGEKHKVFIPNGYEFDPEIKWYGPGYLLHLFGDVLDGTNKYTETSGKYVVKPGDTLGALAKKFGTTVDALAKKNGFIVDKDLIYPNQEILY